jgi:predicted nucleic-acid-binding Zn-ribbon protein
VTIVEMNGRRPTGDDLPITLDFDDGAVPGGPHACSFHPAPSTVRDCIKCGATIFPHAFVQCSEGHFLATFALDNGQMLASVWCHECDAFVEVLPW